MEKLILVEGLRGICSRDYLSTPLLQQQQLLLEVMLAVVAAADLALKGESILFLI